MMVNEIFYSIDGEGIRAGFPVVFIRLSGCNLDCAYCDTRYHVVGRQMSVEQIMTAVRAYKPCLKVTLTGGEPLIHPHAISLVKRLINEGYEVNIETNGSILIQPYLLDGVIVTMDYKCPTSGMESKMMIDNLASLRKQDVLKFVVGDVQDLDRMREMVTTKNIQANVFVSPAFGMILPKEIVEYIKSHGLVNVRVQLQLHKVIWDINARGV